MATQTSKPSSGNGSKSRTTQPVRRSSSGIRSNQRRRRSHLPEKGGFRIFLELVFLTFFGRVLLVSLALAFVVGLNLLISQNQFDRFFIMTGIELVLLGLFLWLRMMLRKPEGEG